MPHAGDSGNRMSVHGRAMGLGVSSSAIKSTVSTRGSAKLTAKKRSSTEETSGLGLAFLKRHVHARSKGVPSARAATHAQTSDAALDHHDRVDQLLPDSAGEHSSSPGAAPAASAHRLASTRLLPRVVAAHNNAIDLTQDDD
jgi:hypothetical protein